MPLRPNLWFPHSDPLRRRQANLDFGRPWSWVTAISPVGISSDWSELAVFDDHRRAELPWDPWSFPIVIIPLLDSLCCMFLMHKRDRPAMRWWCASKKICNFFVPSEVVVAWRLRRGKMVNVVCYKRAKLDGEGTPEESTSFWWGEEGSGLWMTRLKLGWGSVLDLHADVNLIYLSLNSGPVQ